MAVPSRLWLGKVISPHRDLTLILTVVRMVRRAARGPAFLICGDRLASYRTAFDRVFLGRVRTCLAAARGWCPHPICCWSR